MSPISNALSAVIDAYFVASPTETDWLQRSEFDPEWTSPCEIGFPDTDGMIGWRPVLCDESFDWQPLEDSIGTTVRDDIKQFFTTYWCRSFETEIDGGNIIITQFWNSAERDRALSSLGQMAATQRNDGLPISFTIAVFTDDRYIVCRNDNGEVLLIDHGREPVTLFSSISEFLNHIA